MATPRENRARMQFLTWVKNTFPDLYSAAIEVAEANEAALTLSGLGEAKQPSFWNKVGGALTSLGTTYLALKNQRDAMKINLERARQGQPPIDVGAAAPVVRTQIDLPPDVVNKITAEGGAQVNKILLFGAAALAAFLLLGRR